MTITGQYVDGVTGKGIPYVYTDVYGSSDISGIPSETFDADSNGNFSHSSLALDSGNAVLSAMPNGYYQVVGGPSVFNGPIEMQPVSSSSFKIPGWAWILLIFVAAYFGYKYRHQIKSLI